MFFYSFKELILSVFELSQPTISNGIVDVMYDTTARGSTPRPAVDSRPGYLGILTRVVQITAPRASFPS